MGTPQLNPDQSGTRHSSITAIAAVDLTGKRSFLGVLANSGGVRQVNLPAANTDLAIYLIDEEGAAGDEISLSALTPGENFFVRAKGAGNPGDKLSLADVATAADKGKLRKTPTTTGTFVVLAIAEQAFADGELVLCRYVGPYPITNS